MFDLHISFDLVPEAILILVIGMAGIFIALTFVFIFCVLLTKKFPEKKRPNTATEDEENRRDSS